MFFHLLIREFIVSRRRMLAAAKAGVRRPGRVALPPSLRADYRPGQSGPIASKIKPRADPVGGRGR